MSHKCVEDNIVPLQVIDVSINILSAKRDFLKFNSSI
jgi:hypothetical protein